MNLRHREVHLFFNALSFFTRIPTPDWVEYSAENLNRASRYFTWVGLLIGLVAAAVYAVSSYALPGELAILLSMFSTIWLTGGFHEDGLADVCDGFGGGWQKEQILHIMKDSRVGTYGVLGVVLALMFKFVSLSHISVLLPVIVLAHVLSRFAALTLIYADDYVQEDQLSKAKPLAQAMTGHELAIATLPLAFCFLFLAPAALIVLAPVWLMRSWLSRFFKRWIGGYTGDCLGATQQLCELVIYLFFCLPFMTMA